MYCALALLLPSLDVGVGHAASEPSIPHPDEKEALADVRSTDARSAEIDRCCGVALSFQVSLYNVEPSEAILARNLFTKQERRAALRDETEKFGPEVSVIVGTFTATCRAKWLTWGTPSPHRVVVRDPSAAQGMTPNTDARKEVAL